MVSLDQVRFGCQPSAGCEYIFPPRAFLILTYLSLDPHIATYPFPFPYPYPYPIPISIMSRSTTESLRDNKLATSTFSTPFGLPFFGWSEDGQYRKFSMAELRSQYDAWERQQRCE